MKKIIIAYILSFLCVFSHVALSRPWSVLYKKELSLIDTQKYSGRKEMLFAKSDVLPFTQLIFSWNSERPKKGHFSFYVSARDAVTKQWYNWHKMMEWGDKRQITYSSTHKNGTGYHHVRLEVPTGQKADAFKIKIMAQQGAKLSLIRNIYVSVADYRRFKTEVGDKMIHRLSSTQIHNIPRFSQMKLRHKDADRMCSPTSSSMLINSVCAPYAVKPLDFALAVYDHGLDTYGSWAFNTVHAYEICRDMFSFHVERLPSFHSLYAFLKRGVPVVVSVRGELPGAAKVYESGHLIVVIGYDAKKKKVLCHDPAFVSTSNVFNAYNIDDFLRAWEQSRRLAYIAQPLL